MGQYFEVILFILLVVCAVVAGLDAFLFAGKRKRRAQSQPDFAGLSKKQKQERLKAPLVADYARSLLPVFLIVFLIRSFVVEPFRVPSGSMLPTIQLNDWLLINKFSYGLRLPITHQLILRTGSIERGDVAVVHYPTYPSIYYIKTVIGLPGDRISMINNQLYVNGKALPTKLLGPTTELNNADLGQMGYHSTVSPLLVMASEQTIGHTVHEIYNSPIVPITNFKNLVVPKGEYFLMGDNRDNSDDSRYWGFVPQNAFVGRAFLIWFSWDSRTDSVRWNRIGKLLP